MSNVLAMIPARQGSTRLKDKMLIQVDHKPIIVHTVERVLQTKKVGRVVVCTDDLRIKDAVTDYYLPNEKVVIKCNDFDCDTGMDRTSLTLFTYPELRIGMDSHCLLHVHGDEASINPLSLDLLVERHRTKTPHFSVTQLLCRTYAKDRENKNSCKVSVNWKGEVENYSREDEYFYTAIGAWALDHNALMAFHKFEKSEREKQMSIEQDRYWSMGCVKGGFDPKLGEVKSAIDTQSDLDRFKTLVMEWE